ncbi:MAG: ABC transporter permease [Gemmatimonadota bacterium]
MLRALWRQLRRGLRILTHRPSADREIDDEVQHYLEQATAAHLARGLPPAQAARAARLELGSVTSVREQVREYGWENLVETLIADLRYAARRLRGAPGFTIITVLTLALGIGATTAIFSAVNPILFETLPYPEADRIAAVWEMNQDGSRSQATFGMYRELAQRNRTLSAVAAFKPWQPTMTGAGQPERFDGQRVSASYFNVLGVQPSIGRDFERSDDRLNGPNVVILSDAIWERRFARDRAIIGRQVTLDDKPYEVIGVMPEGFESVLAPAAALWAPLQYDMSQGRAWGHHLLTIARLQPGVTTDQAAKELDGIGQSVLDTQRPETYGSAVAFSVTSLQDDVIRGVKPALLAVLGAVMLVLVIACVNVTNLLLARGAQRRGEFALRAALGARRGRLIRQLLTESLLLAALGGAVGMMVALVGVRALVALSPPGLPRVGAIGLDRTVFAFGFTITTLIGLIFGLLPALQAARRGPRHDLERASRRTAGGQRGARNALVVMEVAIALVLLVGSGLLLRSLQTLFEIPSGFDASHLLTMQVQTSQPSTWSDSAAHRSFKQTLAAVRRLPGVTAAGLTSQLPLSGDRDEYGVHFESSTDGFNTFRYAVSPGYIETMRIPLRRGRLLTEQDQAGAPLVALISESLAKRRFPGADALGQRLSIGPIEGYTIVGVVGDVKQLSLALTESDAVYTTTSQWAYADNAMTLVVRARADAAALTPAIRQAVWAVDRDQPIVRVATMHHLLADSAAERRFALILFETFALAALVLAAAGIYGVIAGSVAERTREIGVRSALGATRGDIIRLIIRQGMSLTGIGLAIGVVAAVIATRAITTLLFGVSRLDGVTYVSVITLLIAVALGACGVPASRAARFDPVRTLRAD